MCEQGKEIMRMKNLCRGSIGVRNTDVDVMYAQLHLDCIKVFQMHLDKCPQCRNEALEQAA